MNDRTVWSILENLAPVDQIPITWDSTGYTSAAFNAEVKSADFTGWDGDLADDEEASLIVKLLGAGPGDSILDVACGYGRHDLLFAGVHGLRVTGVDIAPGLIATARRLASARGLNIDYRLQHARDMDLYAEFDYAMVGLNSFSLFSPKDAERVLGNIRHALKPNGKLFLDLDNKPHYCRYGTRQRNWYLASGHLVLQDIYFHHDISVETARDVALNARFDSVTQFVCFKCIYGKNEISALLESAGFRMETVRGNWDLTPLDDSSPKMILVASLG